MKWKTLHIFCICWALEKCIWLSMPFWGTLMTVRELGACKQNRNEEIGNKNNDWTPNTRWIEKKKIIHLIFIRFISIRYLHWVQTNKKKFKKIYFFFLQHITCNNNFRQKNFYTCRCSREQYYAEKSPLLNSFANKYTKSNRQRRLTHTYTLPHIYTFVYSYYMCMCIYKYDFEIRTYCNWLKLYETTTTTTILTNK